MPPYSHPNEELATIQHSHAALSEPNSCYSACNSLSKSSSLLGNKVENYLLLGHTISSTCLLWFPWASLQSCSSAHKALILPLWKKPSQSHCQNWQRRQSLRFYYTYQVTCYHATVLLILRRRTLGLNSNSQSISIGSGSLSSTCHRLRKVDTKLTGWLLHNQW